MDKSERVTTYKLQARAESGLEVIPFCITIHTIALYSTSLGHERKSSFQRLDDIMPEHTVECTFIIEPPVKVQCGGSLYPPFLLQLSKTGDDSQSTYVANITLLNENDENVSDALLGPKSAQGAFRPDSEGSYLFAFPESQISTEGTFHLRADIYKMEQGLRLVTQVSSRDIDATGNTVPRAIASKSTEQRACLGRATHVTTRMYLTVVV